MNESAIYHLSESPYSYPMVGGRFFFRLRLGKEDRDSEVYVIYGNKFFLNHTKSRMRMPLERVDGLFAYFEVVAKLTDNRVGYVFEIHNGGKTYFYSEEGLTETYDLQKAEVDYFEFSSVHDEDISKIPAWAKEAVFYQIFPDRFRIGNDAKDKSYINLPWGGEPKRESFAGGDLKGITDSIEYLNELGINAIYLTPIFRSNSNHKYDTLDYMQIDPQFGTEEDLKNLIAKAHEHGIKIVLDAVFNHISYQSAQFQDALRNGKESKYWDWFFVDGDKIDVERKNYQTFSIARYMPKLNVLSPSCKEYLIGVALHYLDLGIDGWRLDVADEVSHPFWREFRSRIKAKHPEAIIIGEHWHNAHSFLNGDEFDGVMNYPVKYAISDYLASKKNDAKKTAERLNYLFTTYRYENLCACLNLLDSHDTARYINLCDKNELALEASIALLFFVPGMSCLYYGTEIPMEGGDDPDCRRCFPWDKAKQGSRHADMVKRLIGIRKSIGADRHFHCYEQDGMLIVERLHHGHGYRLTINAGNNEKGIIAYPLICSNYQSGVLGENGFLIEEL